MRIKYLFFTAALMLLFSCNGNGKQNPDDDPKNPETETPDEGGEDKPDPEPEEKPDTLQLRVMSFNILQSTGEDAGHTWAEYREQPCKKMFQETDPDIICLQECRRTQLSFMKSNFPGYTYYQYAKDGVKKAGYENTENCTNDGIWKNGGHRDVIAIRKDCCELLDWGRYWFSENPDVSSYDGIYAGGGTPKVTLWVKLHHKEKDFDFFVWCTHFFPHGDTATRTLCSTMSVERMKEQVKEDDVVFFCGDLNLKYENEALDPMKKYMDNARIKATETDNSPTYTGFRTDASTWTLIDHIFYRNAQPLTYKVVNTPIENGTSVCSDHFPIYADFRILIPKKKQ